MECNYEVGKIYDSIFYGIMHFHGNIVLDRFESCYLDCLGIKDSYDEVKTEIPALPSILSPIFYPQHNGMCVLTSFFREQVDFSHETIDSFLCKIASKSSLFRAKIATFLFSDMPSFATQNISSDSLVETILTSDHSQEFKLLISLLFGQFEYAINLLITYLRMIYVQVGLFHQRRANIIASVLERAHSKQNEELYKQSCKAIFSLEFTNDSSTILSISLFNPYLYYFAAESGQFRCILGPQHEKGARFRSDEPNVDLTQVLLALGHPTRIAIINTLREHDELTGASISKLLQMSPVTVLRHIAVLFENAILYVSRRDGIQIFYKINYKMLETTIKVAKIFLKGKNKNDETERQQTKTQMEQTGV